jgi:hypothetical protein
MPGDETDRTPGSYTAGMATNTTITTVEIPVDVFDRLLDFMERMHEVATCDPRFVGERFKLGERVFADLKRLGAEQGFTAMHERAVP